jgi:dynein heavy chain, axonemal
MNEKKPLKKLRKKQNLILGTLQMMSRKEITKILRCKVNALCVIEIHSRDTVDRMYKTGMYRFFIKRRKLFRVIDTLRN